ncbi:MAG TPA: TolC family protein [Opitutaceae bacterium]|nr:TolC family protein [Opitutaceae bacterium]
MKLAHSSQPPVPSHRHPAVPPAGGGRGGISVKAGISALVLLALALAPAGAQPAPVVAANSAPVPVPDTLDLRTAIEFALQHNFAILQAKERIRQQEGIVIEVASRSLPNAAIGSSYSDVDKRLIATPFPGIPVHTDNWNIGLNITENVFAGGAIRSSIKSAKLARDAAVLDLQNTINNALLQVRTSFYNVLLAREKIKVQESNLQLLQSQLKTATDRYRAGTVSSFEQLRAEVAVANAQVPLITARNDYRLAIESLRQALGFTTNTPEMATKVPEFIGNLEYTPESFDLEAAFSAAHANRPDLLRLSKLADARLQDIRTQRAGYYPTLQVTGGYQYKNSPYLPTRFNDALNGWNVGIQSNWSIFDGRATSGRVRQARSAAEQAKLALNEAQLAADVQVRQAYSQWQEATELVQSSQKVVDQATEAVRLANARYAAGTSTQLDVLQAQVDLTTASTNRIQAYYTYDVAVASLRNAMGVADQYVTHGQ